jgi:hypothetical protein
VSIVQLTFVSGHQITAVTLLDNGGAQTFHFCATSSISFRRGLS